MLIDLSHVIEDGLETYRGLPAPKIDTWQSREASRERYAPGTEFHIGRIHMVANTGTYLDAPYHRFADGDDIAALSLESLADLRGVVVEAEKTRAIDAKMLAGLPLAGRAVLIRTGWARHWGTEAYFSDNPYLTADAAAHLVDAGAALVGIDSLNIDDPDDGTRPVHTALLRARIPVVEHLCNLDAIPIGDFRFFAVPARVRAMGTFPVRAFAISDA